MPKLTIFILCIVSIILTPKQSFATVPENTSGHYFQVDVIHAKTKQEYLLSTEAFEENTVFADNTQEDSDVSYGLSYKYAFTMKDTLIDPFGRIFIAPGIFYEDIKFTTKDALWDDNVTLRNRYGLKLDFGWDFDYGLAAYFTNGISAMNYKANWFSLTDSQKYPVSGRTFAYFYGFGLAYSPNNLLSFIIEASQQKNNVKAAPDGGYAQTGVIFGEVEATNRFFKFGIALHF